MSDHITITERLQESEATDVTLTLPYDLRQKSRLRTTLDNGNDVGLILERGKVLRDGDCLRANDGTIVQVKAAAEKVSTVYCTDCLLLSRASYHLGNRHVPLHISKNILRYQQDHVLDSMLEVLGLAVKHELAPFEPESGAYHTSGFSQQHAHSHDNHGLDNHGLDNHSHDKHGHENQSRHKHGHHSHHE